MHRILQLIELVIIGLFSWACFWMVNEMDGPNVWRPSLVFVLMIGAFGIGMLIKSISHHHETVRALVHDLWIVVWKRWRYRSPLLTLHLASYVNSRRKQDRSLLTRNSSEH